MNNLEKIISEEKPNEDYGKVHVLFGKGKGKTTSTLGITIRAAVSGLSVKYVQFMKGNDSNDSKVLKNFLNVDYFCPGNHDWAYLNEGLDEKQKKHAELCFSEIENMNNNYNILICDEILNVPFFSINKDFDYSKIKDLIKNKEKNLELVLSGLYCPESVLELSDYVSRIKNIKHPYSTEGLPAREGIEY